MAISFLTPKISSLSDILEGGTALGVDGELAERLLSECPYAGQRPLNEDRALLLASAMEHGTFLPNTQISFGRMKGCYHLVNGQHRLNGVSLSGKKISFRIEVYECSSKADLDALYCRFDQPGGTRSLTQISGSLGLHDENTDGLTSATAALLLRATPLLMIDLRRIAPVNRPRNTRDLDEKRVVALSWKSQAIDYQKCLAGGLTKRTGRFRAGGVFAVALVTLRYQNERAVAFWKEAVRDNGLMSGDPRHALHAEFLSSKRATTEYDLAEKACNAWNAWFQNRHLTVCKALGSPLKILGTPYLGE